jgi:rare lipoprotein A
MLVPVPPIPAAVPLAPVGIASAATGTLTSAPLHTSLRVNSAQLNVRDGSSASVTGSLVDVHRSGVARRVVFLQALEGSGWSTVSHARTNARGRFNMSYAPRRIGSQLLRLRFAGDTRDLAARRRLGTMNVYRLAGASWYGGGGGMACGGQLTSSTLGVANKTLPCGTLVTLRYNGRTIRVPVVDRGPYVEGREFDLTEAAKYALGFGDTGNVWSTR